MLRLSRKFPSESLITGSRFPRGVLRRVSNHGVLDHVSRFASRRQILVVSFSDRPRPCRDTRKKGCPCGGRLHCANYPRKPRGTPVQLPEPQRLRPSFCCDRDGCRKRVTPPSVRFLGRKVYFGAVIIVISAMRQGPTPRRVRELSRRFGADRRTIACWQVFWREHFPQTPFWKVARAHLAPVAKIVTLPYSLVDAFLRRRAPCKGQLMGKGTMAPPWTHPPAAVPPTRAGRGCCAFSHRSRSPEARQSRSHDDRPPPAEDARRPIFSAGV